ncbi:unnamed protein product [Closterium sp. Naga37s-1]|nr:unnamed protein product [Closterium sp. Naga37s-1]
MLKVQKLYDACKAAFSSHAGSVPSRQPLQRVRDILESIEAADVGLDEVAACCENRNAANYAANHAATAAAVGRSAQGDGAEARSGANERNGSGVGSSADGRNCSGAGISADGRNPAGGSARGGGEATRGGAAAAPKCSPPITYLHLYECDDFSIGIFCIPASATIPLHNHPGMTVLSKLLFGCMHVRSFDWAFPTEPSTDPYQPRLAELVEDQVVAAPCPPDILFPTSGGNIHSFTALSPCAVLDVLAPPYNADAGRHCTYFRELAPASFPALESTEGLKEGVEYGWLEEFQPPDSFVVRRGNYRGPMCKRIARGGLALGEARLSETEEGMSEELQEVEIEEREPRTVGRKGKSKKTMKGGEFRDKGNEEGQGRDEESKSDAPTGASGLETRGNEGARVAIDTDGTDRWEKRKERRDGRDANFPGEKYIESEKASGGEAVEEWTAKRVPESEVLAEMKAQSSPVTQGPTPYVGNGVTCEDTIEESARPASVEGRPAAIITSSVTVDTADAANTPIVTMTSAATATSTATADGNLTAMIGADGSSTVASQPEISLPGSGEPMARAGEAESSGATGSAGAARNGGGSGSGGLLRSEEGRRGRRRGERQSWSGACMFWSIALLIVVIAALGAYLTADGQLPNDTVRYLLVATTVVFAVASLALLLAIRYVDPGIVPPSAAPDPVVVRAEMGDVSPELLRDSSGQWVRAKLIARQALPRNRHAGAHPAERGTSPLGATDEEMGLPVEGKGGAEREGEPAEGGAEEKGGGGQEVVEEVETQRYCITCHVWKGPRTSHCSECGSCMERLDHHCDALGTCIARRNHRFFIAFLLASSLVLPRLAHQPHLAPLPHLTLSPQPLYLNLPITLLTHLTPPY